jgi:cellulose synthase/poly-beta-1,6-N-acetylglucosamine synthase-like glycosyltransferase
MTFFVPRIQPGDDSAWPNSSCATHLPPPLNWSRDKSGANDRPQSEAALLLSAGLPPPILQRITAMALRWGVPLRQAALSIGAVKPHNYVAELGVRCEFRDTPKEERIKLRALDIPPPPYRHLSAPLPMPLEAPRGAAALNGEQLSLQAAQDLAASLGTAKGRVILVGRRALSEAIAEAYGPRLAREAEDGLSRKLPRFSASTGVNSWQTVCLAMMGGLFAGAAIFAPREALVIYSAALSLMFLLTISLRLAAAAHAGYARAGGRKRPIPRLKEAELPRYTVLVAMYKEARVLPHLVAALEALDYPPAKLDVKLVLEEDDAETIAAAGALLLPPHFEVVVVPDGTPRTKPRALNYALQFATGDHLVIYDAEDRPDPDQLRKGAGRFSDAPREVVCLQARLTFDNASENWLAKQFAIEYASLFGGILPMLDAARLPLPLGGTSNHFRTAALRKIGGWDPHNVTEDADLGIRLYRRGFRAEVLDSTTYEEAACQPGNWLRQRTRWLKGWVQTYGVHMRQPVRLARELGMPGFLAFQGHFAGIIIAALVHPLSYAIILHDAVLGLVFQPAESAFGHQLWLIAVFNLVAGYVASLALGFFVLRGKRVRSLVPQLVFIPIYWLFISAAAYRAVYQLIKAPHYWEKTEHGLTSFRRTPNRKHPQ